MPHSFPPKDINESQKAMVDKQAKSKYMKIDTYHLIILSLINRNSLKSNWQCPYLIFMSLNSYFFKKLNIAIHFSIK